MKHVVFFRFPDDATTAEAARQLRALEGVVPTLRSIEVGIDTLRSERSWDLCLITTFDDFDGMQAYQVHPAHQEVVAWIKAHGKGSAAVDWT